MIGVICKENEKDIAKEYFELFKTPWEFFVPGRKYEVVLLTTEETNGQIVAPLIITYSARRIQSDDLRGISAESVSSPDIIVGHDIALPIYKELVILHSQGRPLLWKRLMTNPVAVEICQSGQKIIRVGYDLFNEISFLLSDGQPAKYSEYPSLDIQIALLRSWIVGAGIPIAEIPPIPLGYRFFACLTHDIDFVGIRRHKFDHTMWGFVYRALIGSAVDFLRGKVSFKKLIKNWFAAIKLPLVFIGVADDFWEHFDEYSNIDVGFGSTFFLIPFKNNPGAYIGDKSQYKRSVSYQVDEVAKQVKQLMDLGFEVGLHGIDAWNSSEKGFRELSKIVEVIGHKDIGVRMHWLFYDHTSPSVLEQTGFEYDATLGYNDTVGFKNGTSQIFRPIGLSRLLEIPLNIQDTALFYPRRLNLSENSARQLCTTLLNVVCCYGGVLTLSWHERSLRPERLWGDFYRWLLKELQANNAWIGNARQIVDWFRWRRSVIFQNCNIQDGKLKIDLLNYDPISKPGMFIRFHIPSRSKISSEGEYTDNIVDLQWNGESAIEISIPNEEV